jgi:D-inositol-3-phosphate glycosyltransferase
MKILMTSHYSLPHRGGVEVLVAELSKRWRAQGHQVIHQTSSIGAPLCPRNDEQGLDGIHVLPAMNFLEKYAIPYPLFNPVALYRSLDALIREADVVNVHGMLYMNSVIAARLAQHQGIPVVLSECPGFVSYRSPLVNLVERAAFETVGRSCSYYSDAVIVINERVARFLGRYVRSDTIIERIDVGVDTNYFKPAAPQRRAELREKWHLEKPAVLFVGRLVPRKGISHLGELSSDVYELIICGRGDKRIDHPNARFLGFVSDVELLELYQATDLFVLLTDGDDFPLVGLETMACGLPVIAFDTPANREYYGQSTALLVDGSINGVRLGIQVLVNDEQRRQALGNAARTRAVKMYDWARTAAAYLRLFERLVTSRRM